MDSRVLSLLKDCILTTMDSCALTLIPESRLIDGTMGSQTKRSPIAMLLSDPIVWQKGRNPTVALTSLLFSDFPTDAALSRS